MAAKDHVAVRLDPSTLERLETLREVLTTEWHEATQSDALRAVILTGLKVLEKEHAGRLADVKRHRDDERPEKPSAVPRHGRKTKPGST